MHAPLLASMVRAQRLSLLASHFKAAPKVVQMMVEALPKPTSAQMLLYYLEQFAMAFPDVGERLGSPSAHTEKWRAYIVESPRRWKNKTALMKWWIPDRPDPPATRRLRGKQTPPPPAASDKPLLTCPACGKQCKGPQGLAAHSRRKHGRKMTARSFCIGSVCPACGVDYHTRPRALHHLQFSSKACRAAMLAGELPECSAEEISAADLRDRIARKAANLRGDTRARALAPPSRGLGARKRGIGPRDPSGHQRPAKVRRHR